MCSPLHALFVHFPKGGGGGVLMCVAGYTQQNRGCDQDLQLPHGDQLLV